MLALSIFLNLFKKEMDKILLTRPTILLDLAQIGKQVKWGLQNFSEQKKLNPTFSFILFLQAFQLMQCTSALVATDHCKSSRKATAHSMKHFFQIQVF